MGIRRIPDEYLRIIEAEGMALKSEGIDDIGLRPEAALRAVAVMRRELKAVLGGEAWRLRGDRFEFLYDIWNIERSTFDSEEKFLTAGWQLAEAQATRYLSDEGVIIVLRT